MGHFPLYPIRVKMVEPHAMSNLQTLFPVKHDSFLLDRPILYVRFRSYDDDGNFSTYPFDISLPVRDVLAGNTRCQIKHDNRRLGCERKQGREFMRLSSESVGPSC